VGQGIPVGEREVTGAMTAGDMSVAGMGVAGLSAGGLSAGGLSAGGLSAGGLSLVGDPVVDRADLFTDEQSETAELPSPAQVFAELPSGEFDPLVAWPAAGVRGWSGRLRAVLAGCVRPLVLLAALCAGPMHLFTGRVADTMVAAPALSDLAGGIGLLLLPLMWLSYLALIALPVALCLAGTVTVALGWASGDRQAGLRAVPGTALHRVGPLWAWLAAVGAVAQVRWLIPDDIAGPVGGLVLSVCAAALAALLAVLMGVLGCVVLFERGRGPRRALWLLGVAPRGAVAGLGLAGAALAVLPVLVDAAVGSLAGAAAAVLGALLWAVAALVTYAQARRVEGPLTTARLRWELSV